jgi:hypothetical protein
VVLALPQPTRGAGHAYERGPFTIPACRGRQQRFRRAAEGGSYGFNWLDPENARCRALSGKDIAAMKSCTDSANAFGIELPSKACRVDRKIELIVYDSKEHCQQGLETMQANAP